MHQVGEMSMRRCCDAFRANGEHMRLSYVSTTPPIDWTMRRALQINHYLNSRYWTQKVGTNPESSSYRTSPPCTVASARYQVLLHGTICEASIKIVSLHVLSILLAYSSTSEYVDSYSPKQPFSPVRRYYYVLRWYGWNNFWPKTMLICGTLYK